MVVLEQQARTDQLPSLFGEITCRISTVEQPHADHRRFAAGALGWKGLSAVQRATRLGCLLDVVVRPLRVPPALRTSIIQAEHRVCASAATEVGLIVPGGQVVPATI